MYELKTNPWAHQWQALDFTMTHDHAAIFTDMGSGKTKIMIDTIINKKFKVTFVVGTKKSCEVWKNEFALHSNLAPELVSDLSKLSTKEKTTFLRKKLLADDSGALQEVFIVNYDSIWLKPFSDLLLKTKIDCVICDESHRLKSPSSKASRFMARLGKKVKYRYILSGTPTPEAPTDIYGQYRFLDPSIFGTNFGTFKNRYTNIDPVKSSFCGFPILDSKQPYKNLDELKEKMYSCAFYAKSDIELPDVTHIDFEQRISNEAEKVYKELNKEGVYEDENGVLETNNILAKCTRLQQILSGYLDMENEDFTRHDLFQIDTSKVEALQYILEEIPNQEKVVVFAKYRKDFENIEKICDDLNRIYGEVSGQRDDYADWKKGRINLLAVQYNSGSESISLVEARYCIYYSHTFSYGKYQQSLKRTHRPGQKKPVTYYHIVSTVKGIQSIDEKIKKALSLKQSLSEYILNEIN